MAAVSATGAMSCVIPPPGEVVDVDASTINSPPQVVGAAPSPDFDFPGPLFVQRGDTRTVTLTFRDNDTNDTLYVRFFVDYDEDAPSHQTCGINVVPPPTEGFDRSQDFCLATWCAGISDEDFHTLEIFVADRPFDDLTPPTLRSVEAGGAIGQASWRIQCAQEM